jgi:hypothetical protein
VASVVVAVFDAVLEVIATAGVVARASMMTVLVEVEVRPF